MQRKPVCGHSVGLWCFLPSASFFLITFIYEFLTNFLLWSCLVCSTVPEASSLLSSACKPLYQQPNLMFQCRSNPVYAILHFIQHFDWKSITWQHPSVGSSLWSTLKGFNNCLMIFVKFGSDQRTSIGWIAIQGSHRKNLHLAPPWFDILGFILVFMTKGYDVQQRNWTMHVAVLCDAS